MGEVSLRQRLEEARARLSAGRGAPSPQDFADAVEYLAALERELASMGRAVEDADERLLAIENSRLLQLVRIPRRLWGAWRGRLGQVLLHSPLHRVYLAMAGQSAADASYEAWVAREQAAVPPPEWFASRVREMTCRPVISVLMPVYRPRREWLEAAVESVRQQTYPYWELCICDDGSPENWIAEYLAAKAATDPRIRVCRSESNQGIVAGTNAAAALCSGEYAAFLDQDDQLPRYAIHYVAEALQRGPADLLYSDEDRLNAASARVEPIFRPAWSPDLLLSCMYMGHLLVVRRLAAERVGWLRSGFEGGQDYDLALRVAEAGGPVRHIPRVLYHWRRHEGSTAAHAGAKPYAQEAGRRALCDALERSKCSGVSIQDGPVPHSFRLVREPSGALASIVICSRSARLMRRCLRAIAAKTSYARREIVVVHHLGSDDRAMEQLLAAEGCIRIPYPGEFDFAAMNRLGAAHAHGEVLVFLNDDAAPLSPEWLAALVAQVERPCVGVAGARLLYPSGAIQHAGLAIGIMNGVGHPHRDTFGSGCWPWWALARNLSAVTGACLAIRATVFNELGGFDQDFPVNYNDADLCLRAREAGYQVIYEPVALLRHDECRTRRPGVRYSERERWERRWGALLAAGDPFYNPNLSQRAEDAGMGESTPGLADNAR